MENSTKNNLEIRGLQSKDVWKYENGWFWFSAPSRIAKIIAHYELYKRCTSLPGAIAEFGVYKGNSLIQIATFQHMLELPGGSQIYAFDAFGTFPDTNIHGADDQKFITKFSNEGGEGSTLSDIKAIMDYKNFKNINLIEGDVRNTLPEFIEKNPQVRFKFVHLDMDVYEPTAFVLPYIYERLVYGGIIMIDDYNAVGGATRAIDAFLEEHPELKLHKLPINNVPAYITK